MFIINKFCIFMQNVRNTFSKLIYFYFQTTTNDNVRSRILELIQIWAHAFRNEPKYRAVQDIFNMLKMEGNFFAYFKKKVSIY